MQGWESRGEGVGMVKDEVMEQAREAEMVKQRWESRGGRTGMIEHRWWNRSRNGRVEVMERDGKAKVTEERRW